MTLNEYRITKYNPIFRNEDGYYLKDEWTDVSDVGKTFEGKMLTEKKYLETEKAYITSVFKMLEISNLNHVRIVGMWPDNLNERIIEVKNRWYFESAFESIVIFEDKLIQLNELELVLKLIFRGILSCRLEVCNQFYVHFGYDYYMYIGGKEITETACKEISNSQLFIEPFGSPYYSKFHKWYLETVDQEMLIVDKVEVPFINAELIRKQLNLSNEHPADVGFEIVQDNVDILNSEFKIEFGQYRYFVSCDHEICNEI